MTGRRGMASVTWRTSSHSNDIDACIEVAGLAGGGWAVRDSKDPRGAVLMFTAAEWTAFVGGVRDGEFRLTTCHR